MMIKRIVKETLRTLHLDVTQNMKYERLTEKIIDKCINSATLCIDIGCHKGEVMELFLEKSPNLQHYGFEPIPMFYEQIQNKFQDRCRLFNIALSDERGETTFNYVKNAPAFSGLRKRDYSIANPDIEIIQVQLNKLDNIIPTDENIGFIKIDVEGAEYSVLKGAEATISRCKPYILFEFGIGASNYYDTTPSDMFKYFADKNMFISLLNDWLNEKAPLNLNEFEKHFEANSEYYFIAHK